MKRHGNLFERIVDIDNLEEAYNKAKRGKTWQDKVKEFDENKDENLSRLRQSLIDGTFTTSEYRIKTIHEPKERQIFILPFFPDRIVQHALMNIISPIWDKMMIKDSYACRKGKGQHKGSMRCMQFVRRNSWICQFDISKFYPSINHEILLRIIGRKIKDKRVMALFENIITSIDGATNVPIGNYTSQWFGNLYMNELDTFVKHNLHVRDYIRYCDDFLIFGKDKETLKGIMLQTENFVTQKLKLRLSKKALYPTSHGVDFLGYRHFPNGKMLVRKSTAKRVRRRIKALPWDLSHGKITHEQAMGKLASAHGWLKHANAYNLRMSIDFDEIYREVRLSSEAVC